MNASANIIKMNYMMTYLIHMTDALVQCRTKKTAPVSRTPDSHSYVARDRALGSVITGCMCVLMCGRTGSGESN